MKEATVPVKALHLRRKGLLTIAVLALAIPGSLIGLAHSFDARSTVTIRYADAREAFTGTVSSPNALCIAGRTVKVFKVVDGPNRLIGTDTTGNAGRYWVPRPNAHGYFYARVKKSTSESYGHSHICEADRSGTIHV